MNKMSVARGRFCSVMVLLSLSGQAFASESSWYPKAAQLLKVTFKANASSPRYGNLQARIDYFAALQESALLTEMVRDGFSVYALFPKVPGSGDSRYEQFAFAGYATCSSADSCESEIRARLSKFPLVDTVKFDFNPESPIAAKTGEAYGAHVFVQFKDEAKPQFEAAYALYNKEQARLAKESGDGMFDYFLAYEQSPAAVDKANNTVTFFAFRQNQVYADVPCVKVAEGYLRRAREAGDFVARAVCEPLVVQP